MQEGIGYRIDGVRKMIEDILGKDVVPTPEQAQQIQEGAVLVHERNKINSKKTPFELNQELIDESFTRKGAESFLAQKAREAEAAKNVKPVNYITCDSIADKAAAEGKKPVDEKVVEKTKENKPVPTTAETKKAADLYYAEMMKRSFDAPVDEKLLQRERKYATGSPSMYDRERMMIRYREEMEKEKRKWQQSIYDESSKYRY